MARGWQRAGIGVRGTDSRSGFSDSEQRLCPLGWTDRVATPRCGSLGFCLYQDRDPIVMVFEVEEVKRVTGAGLNTAVRCEPAGRIAMRNAWPSVTGTGLPTLVSPS